MAFLAYLALSYLFLYKEGESLLLGTRDVWVKLPSTLLFIVLVLVVLFPRKVPVLGRPVERAAVPLSYGGSLLLSLAALLFQARYFAQYGYRLEPGWAVLLGLLSVGTLVLAVQWARRPSGPTGGRGRESPQAPTRWFFLLLAAAGATAIGFWTVEILSFPLHPERSNMLPVIEASARTLLDGGNPYRFYDMAGGRWPLNYLPGLWLPYVPQSALGLDPRWLSPPSLLFLAALLLRLSPRSNSGTTLALAGSFLLNPYFLLRHEVYTYFFLLLVALFCDSLLRERRAWSSVLFGLILSSRQTFLPLVPFYFWVVLRRGGLREALARTAVAGGVAAGIVVPFVLADPAAFRAGVFDWHQESLRYSFVQAQRLLSTFTLSSFFFKVDMGRWLQVAQGATTVLLLVVTAPWVKSPLVGLRGMALALLAFLLLNPVAWTYLYLPLLVLLAFTLVEGGQESASA